MCCAIILMELSMQVSTLAAPKTIFEQTKMVTITSSWSDPKRLGEFLYETTFTDYDYAKGAAFMEKYYAPQGACSSLRNGNFVGYNYDGPYDYVREVVIHTSAVYGRHATVGVAASINTVPNNPLIIPVNGYFKYLPFCTLDGMNDAGLVCCLNLVEADYGHTTGTNPGKEKLNVYMAVRYLLDYAGSVDEAIKLLKEKNLYASKNFEAHFLLADPQKTVIVEFVDNKIIVQPGNIMTNFFHTQPGYSLHSKGIERFNILQNTYSSANTESGMFAALKNVFYSKLYDASNPEPWYSDCHSIANEIDINTPITEKQEFITRYGQHFATEGRTGQCWITKHTAVYDLVEKQLTIMAQEDGNSFKLGLEQINYIPGM